MCRKCMALVIITSGLFHPSSKSIILNQRSQLQNILPPTQTFWDDICFHPHPPRPEKGWNIHLCYFVRFFHPWSQHIFAKKFWSVLLFHEWVTIIKYMLYPVCFYLFQVFSRDSNIYSDFYKFVLFKRSGWPVLQLQ